MTPRDTSYRIIPLNKGYECIVDAEDFERLSPYKWRISICRRDGRIVSTAVTASSSPKTIFMHRLILGVTDPKIFVDHRDRNPLNNRKSNLRPCTNRQNQGNAKLDRRNTSGFRGVVKQRRAWVAQIWTSEGRARSQAFDDPKEAARLYDQWALREFGEFANLNFPIRVGEDNAK